MKKNIFEISGQESEIVITFPHKFNLKLRSDERLFLAFKNVDVSLVKLARHKNNGNGGKSSPPSRHLMGTDNGWLMLTNQRLLFYGNYVFYQVTWQQIQQWRSFNDGFSIRPAHAALLYRFAGIERYKISYELEQGYNAIVPMNGSVLREVLDLLHKTTKADAQPITT